MQYRSLGRTGLNVSALSLGGAAFGDMYGKLPPGEVSYCVQRAIDSGINLIDTSPFYGITRSEKVLGEALAGGLREKIILCSKAGRNGPTEFDFSAEGIEKSVDASLVRLGTDYLDILIAHDIEFAENPDQVFGETAEVLHRLKQKGKTRFIGMSGYPMGILARAIEQCRLDVIITYCHFTLQNQRLLTELLPVAEHHGIGIMNASPLAMGLLTTGGPPEWHPASDEIKVACRKAAEHCTARGVDISTLGMQYCFSDRRIHTTISGAARGVEIEKNLRTMSMSLNKPLLKEVQEILAPVQNMVWPSGNWK